MTKRLHQVLTAIGMLAVAVALLISFTKPLELYDEGFALTNAWRVMQGEVPHRDYWAAYPPGTSYVLAMAFTLLEPTVAVSRLVTVLWLTALIGAYHGLVRRLCSPCAAWLLSVVAALMAAIALPPSYSAIPGLALALSSVLLLHIAVERRRRWQAVAAGAVAGLTLLFRHDFAAYLFVAAAAGLGVTFIAQRGRIDRVVCGYAVAFMATFALVASVSLAHIVAAAGWHNFFEQAVEFPARTMRAYRALPVPTWFTPARVSEPDWIMAWTAPMIVGAVLALAALRRPSWTDATWLSVAVTAPMALLLTLQAHHRLDLPHAVPSMLYALLLLGTVATSRATQSSTRPWSKTAGHFVLAAFVALYAVTTWRAAPFETHVACVATRKLSACHGPTPAQEDVLRFVERVAPGSGSVFVGNTRHDIVFVNDAALYFFLRRHIPTRWNEMHPGVVTEEPQQRAMILELERQKVEIVVLARMPLPQEPNRSAVSSGVRLLDNYIADHFRPVHENSMYIVLARNRPGATPAGHLANS